MRTLAALQQVILRRGREAVPPTPPVESTSRLGRGQQSQAGARPRDNRALSCVRNLDAFARRLGVPAPSPTPAKPRRPDAGGASRENPVDRRRCLAYKPASADTDLQGLTAGGTLSCVQSK